MLINMVNRKILKNPYFCFCGTYVISSWHLNAQMHSSWRCRFLNYRNKKWRNIILDKFSFPISFYYPINNFLWNFLFMFSNVSVASRYTLTSPDIFDINVSENGLNDIYQNKISPESDISIVLISCFYQFSEIYLDNHRILANFGGLLSEAIILKYKSNHFRKYFIVIFNRHYLLN